MELFDRLKNYKANAINSKLTSEEETELLRLTIKAMSPPPEAFIALPRSKKAYEEIDAFDNISDANLDKSWSQISEIFTEICITLGKELGTWMYKHNIVIPKDEQLDNFYTEHNLPPRLFNKKLMLLHMYLSELIHRKVNPLPIILNTDVLRSSAEKNVINIYMTAMATNNQLKKDEKVG